MATPGAPGGNAIVIRHRFSWRAAVTVAILIGACGAATSYADPAGKTTRQESIGPGPALVASKPGYLRLVPRPGWQRVIRRVEPGVAVPARRLRRRSLSYFAQMSDFQLADEESPLRVEFLDSLVSSSAWRPQEAFQPQVIDQAIRQINRFAARSPHTNRGSRRARMNFALLTGDLADSQQYNETLWARQLVEGEAIDPNSGVADASHCSPLAQAAFATRPGEAKRYTGVADYSDYGRNGDYYDPNEPFGAFAQWPRYTGLMDRAQRPFTPAGLAVPTYVARGNHDGLVQGNEDANAAFEAIALACDKIYAVQNVGSLATLINFDGPNPNALLGPAAGIMSTPPDPGRRLVSKQEVKAVWGGGRQRDDHGFGFVDPGEDAASNGAASYYAWSPRRGVRFVSLDTVAEGGLFPVGPRDRRTDEGNLDDPQFRWLTRELTAATARDELIVVFSHHPIRSMVSNVRDEEATSCANSTDAHGHDRNPGCDKDPRESGPIHLGTTGSGPEGLRELFDRFPHVVGYVTGHTHENELRPCARAPGGSCPAGAGWWEINSSATADWPQQTRLVELMDNRDGTLSFFGTMLDHAAPTAAPAPGAAGAFGESQLASIGRVFSFNDSQANKAGPGKPFGAIGGPEDRNAEMIVIDPRRSSAGLRRRLRTCGMPVGRIAGRRVGRAGLGRTRRAVRRAFPSFRRLGRRMDRFCLVGGGSTRVGYRSGRAVLALTSSNAYAVRGVRVGSSERKLRRRFRGERRLRVGRSRYYLAGGRRARVVLRVRRGKVREVGLASRRQTRGPARALGFLRAFR